MDPNAPVNQPPVPPLTAQPVAPVQVAPPPSSPPPPQTPVLPQTPTAQPPEPEKKYGGRNVKMWIAIYIVLGIIAYALLYVFVLSKQNNNYTPPTYKYQVPKVIKPKATPTPSVNASQSATITPSGTRVGSPSPAPTTSATPPASITPTPTVK